MALGNKTQDRYDGAIVQRAPQRRAPVTPRQFAPFAGDLKHAVSGPPSALRPGDVLALQRTAGNRATQRMLSGRGGVSRPERASIQTKLTVGPAGDHFEREPDRVAASVMQNSAPVGSQIQRQPAEKEDRDEVVQTKPHASSITPLVQRQPPPMKEGDTETALQLQSEQGRARVTAGLEQRVTAARGGGQPLPEGLRNRMERSFGADFGGVRIHADSGADGLNQSFRARAFTTGQDLFFRHGEYEPESRRGQELIAHELTHVVQQNTGTVPRHDVTVQGSWFGEKRGYFKVDASGKFGNIQKPDGKSEQRVNYNRDRKWDMANYLLIASGAGTAAAKLITDRAQAWTDSSAFLAPSPELVTETGKALAQMGAVSSGLGVLASGVDAYKGFKQSRESSNTAEQKRMGVHRGVSGLTSATQQSAAATFHIANWTGRSAMSATAQGVSGGAALVTGAVDMLRGYYARSKASQNIARLANLQQTSSNPEIKKAAHQAESTQAMRKKTAGYSMFKGLLTAVGGGLLLAGSAVTPFGWLLIGLGGIVGAYSLFKKYRAKQARKEEVGIEELGVRTKRDEWKKKRDKTWRWTAARKALGPDPLEVALKQHGFLSVGHFYANYINYTANQIRLSGNEGRRALEVQVRSYVEAEAAKQPNSKVKSPVRELLNDKRLDDQLPKMAYADITKEFGIHAEPDNPYPDLEKLLAGMGLRFDWTKEPPEPNPEKIGKALHE